MGMQLKLDDEGNAVLEEGKPVYTFEDGSEKGVDVGHMFGKITTLNTESKDHRLAAKAAKEALAVFEGLDADAARKALETVQNLDDKKLVDADQVGQIKAEMEKVHAEKAQEFTKQIETLEGQIRSHLIGREFTNPELLEKYTFPTAAMAEAFFGPRFKVEDGRVVGYNQAGNQIFSREKAGEIADFAEALETMIAEHPDRDKFLRGSGNSGSGGTGNTKGDGAANSKRAALMTDIEKVAYIQKHGIKAWQEKVAADIEATNAERAAK
ncbi:MAG: hypothetical protein GY851_35705 [bacterium]|nr:hypothetical protein [bacterium]